MAYEQGTVPQVTVPFRITSIRRSSGKTAIWADLGGKAPGRKVTGGRWGGNAAVYEEALQSSGDQLAKGKKDTQLLPASIALISPIDSRARHETPPGPSFLFPFFSQPSVMLA
ncbi:hypothetical protein ACLOJK_007377 [Asimina triloba]